MICSKIPEYPVQNFLQTCQGSSQREMRIPTKPELSSSHPYVTQSAHLWSLSGLLHFIMGKSSTKNKRKKDNTHFNFAPSWNPLLMHFSHKVYQKHLAYWYFLKLWVVEQFLVKSHQDLP